MVGKQSTNKYQTNAYICNYKLYMLLKELIGALEQKSQWEQRGECISHEVAGKGFFVVIVFKLKFEE